MIKVMESGMKEYYALSAVADMLSVSKETLRRWDANGKLRSIRLPNNYRVYPADALRQFEALSFLFEPDSLTPIDFTPLQDYTVAELFAGAGGLALGLEQAGLHCQLLNEIDPWACATLRANRPQWQVLEGNVADFSFTEYAQSIDVVTGGFPCQTFSYAGKKLGLEDARGTLFFEFARAVQEIQPLICVGENVRGLLTHDDGQTIAGMISVLDELGYEVIPPKVLKAIFQRVPQKRERLFLVGIKKGTGIQFEYPAPQREIYTVRDALQAGRLFDSDVSEAPGQTYPRRKRQIMEMVPPGGYWRDLPLKIQKEYMLKSFYLGGGKTGMARRMSWDEPCLTLTTSPAQKQTERCHPSETRPFTIREYARIQTFPDDWQFQGSMNQVYKQIGNAVPVNLAAAIGRQLVQSLNEYYGRQSSTQKKTRARRTTTSAN
jgi:DNA (cytosine-5)-methyltransferase 1